MSSPEGSSGVPPPPRLARLDELEETPRRIELRRLAAAGREVIEHLVSTTASLEQIQGAADQLEEVASLLRSLPRGLGYEGFAEAANAGPALTEGRAAILDGAADPERFAFFDHSPFIGLANPMSPPMRFEYTEDRVTATATFGSAYEGPPGCVHGGYVAAAFDELLGAAQSLSGAQGMTARLIVNYRSPTPLHQQLRFEGVLGGRDGRKLYCNGRLWAGDVLCADAEGLFVTFDADRFSELLALRQERMEGGAIP